MLDDPVVKLTRQLVAIETVNHPWCLAGLGSPPSSGRSRTGWKRRVRRTTPSTNRSCSSQGCPPPTQGHAPSCLSDHPVDHERQERLRPDGPLQPTYRRGATLDRFDYIMVSEDFTVTDVFSEFDTESGMGPAGSDHAFLSARLQPYLEGGRVPISRQLSSGILKRPLFPSGPRPGIDA